MHGGMKVYAARRPRPGSTWRQSEDEPTTTTSPRAPGSPAATRDDQGRQRKKSFARKGNADRHAATVEADKVRGTYIEPSKITVAEYAGVWAEARPHRPTTARRTEMMIRLHIGGTRLGGRKLAEVRPSEVQAW